VLHICRAYSLLHLHDAGNDQRQREALTIAETYRDQVFTLGLRYVTMIAEVFSYFRRCKCEPV
jgi:hypothetical protein